MFGVFVCKNCWGRIQIKLYRKPDIRPTLLRSCLYGIVEIVFKRVHHKIGKTARQFMFQFDLFYTKFVPINWTSLKT